MLVPLLGLHNLTSAFMPDGDHYPVLRKVLEVISAVSISFQGSIIAVFFCFMNSEVKAQLEIFFSGSEVVYSTDDKGCLDTFHSGRYFIDNLPPAVPRLGLECFGW